MRLIHWVLVKMYGGDHCFMVVNDSQFISVKCFLILHCLIRVECANMML